MYEIKAEKIIRDMLGKRKLCCFGIYRNVNF